MQRHGQSAVVHRGLLRPEDAAKARAAAAGSNGDAGEDCTPRPAKPDYSERLQRNLTAHRTAAIRAALADNARVALVALVHTMALRVFDDYFGFCRSDGVLRVSITDSRFLLNNCAPELPECRAGKVFDDKVAEWQARLPADPNELFGWLLSQAHGDLLALLALCTAATANAVTGPKDENDGWHPIAKALDLDMAEWWAPTRASYFDHVPKGKGLAAVTEAVSPEAAATLPKLKKDTFAAEAERLVAGTRWLPAVLKLQV
jgi:ParB family transcriptional regulator, chromosome partitioning protein